LFSSTAMKRMKAAPIRLRGSSPGSGARQVAADTRAGERRLTARRRATRPSPSCVSPRSGGGQRPNSGLPIAIISIDADGEPWTRRAKSDQQGTPSTRGPPPSSREARCGACPVPLSHSDCHGPARTGIRLATLLRFHVPDRIAQWICGA
jgi:hypothetical protein